MEQQKKLYPQTDAEWREYCARCAAILLANGARR